MEANSINNEISDYDKLKNYLIQKDISKVKNIIKNKKKSIINKSDEIIKATMICSAGKMLIK